MKQPTQTDRRLIAALRDNARASITQLSHQLNVSRTTIKTRLDDLIQTGYIRRFTIETSAEETHIVRAITTVQLQGSLSRAVIRTLKAIPEVTLIYSTNGAWDLVVEVEAETLPGFDRVLREIREVNGVLNSETSLLLNSV